MGLPQLLAGLYVQKGHAKENGGVEKHREILHEHSLAPYPPTQLACVRFKTDFAIGVVDFAEGISKETIKMRRTARLRK
jgi:hypothetical protein